MIKEQEKTMKEQIGLNSFICYNWMPLVANHALDYSDEFYRSAGVSKLHNMDNLKPEDVKDRDVIFVKTDYIFNGVFQRDYLPKLKNKFTLISAGSSYHIGSNGNMSYLKILNSPNLLKWHCTNPPNVKSHKIVPLPIGFEERERVGGNQKLITEFFNNKTKFLNKKNKILLPHHTFNTNPQRKALFEKLSKLSFIEIQEQKLSWYDYMKLLDQYKFIICLEGSGPDVHRNYETLLVNSIPINIENTIQTLFDYHRLPGIFLKSWSDLNNKKFEELCKNGYNFENISKFLKINYHADLILQHGEE